MKKAILILFYFLSLTGFSQGKKDVTLEEIFSSSTFNQKSVYGVRSMKDGKHYTTQETLAEENMIVKYEYKTGKAVDTLLKESWLKLASEFSSKIKNPDFDFSDYAFSPDENLILLTTEFKPIYRHSYTASFYVYFRDSRKTMPLSTGGPQAFATFAPDSAKIAFVRENNIFIADLTKNKETPVTVDGVKNDVINGRGDWVYEEEFELVKAFDWSPDSKRLAYLRFDESKVKEFTMDEYGGANAYPRKNSFKYPKAGEANSIVTVFVYDLGTDKSIRVPVFKDGSQTDQYIPRIQFTKDPLFLSIQRLNRKQDELELLLADVRTGQSKVILTETSPAYVEITHNLTFLDDGKQFIWSSERDGFNHLYLYSTSGKLLNQITKGPFEVVKHYGAKGNTLYYQAAEGTAMDRQVCSIGLNGSGKKFLSPEKGTSDAEFSDTYGYYLNFHSSISTPTRVTLHSQDGKELRVLEDNENLKKRLQEYRLGTKEFITVKTTGGASLNGWIMKPADFDPSKKYPVLMHVYGGPGINIVNNQWDSRNYFWYQMLCQKGYLVVSVDGRGTGFRGEEFKKCTQGKLGTLETEDQIETAKYLGSLPYVDKSRIGIWGWSYGGYMTALCMTQGADYFKAGISVAPLCHWKFYDSVYSERFMNVPSKNEKGYESSSPITYVEKLKGKFLLIHGTSDDNVHFQNALELSYGLISKGKDFEMFYYPNKNHNISGKGIRLHLYKKLTDFILTNL